MRERRMRGLHELVLEFAFGAWGKGAKRNERAQGDAEEVTVVLGCDTKCTIVLAATQNAKRAMMEQGSLPLFR